MANNLDIKDGNAALTKLSTSETGGVHTPNHIVTSSALPSGAATSAKQDTLIAFFGPPSNLSSSAFEASQVIKASAGTLFSVNVYNKNASDRYLMLFDATSLPVNGTIPKLICAIPAHWSGGVDYGLKGKSFGTGIVAALSSTEDSLTVTVSLDGLFESRYS